MNCLANGRLKAHWWVWISQLHSASSSRATAKGRHRYQTICVNPQAWANPLPRRIPFILRRRLCWGYLIWNLHHPPPQKPMPLAEEETPCPTSWPRLQGGSECLKTWLPFATHRQCPSHRWSGNRPARLHPTHLVFNPLFCLGSSPLQDIPLLVEWFVGACTRPKWTQGSRSYWL